MKNDFIRATVLLLGIATANLSHAEPLLREEPPHRTQVLEQLKKVLGAATTAFDKVAYIERAMTDEPDVSLRGSLLDAATQIPGPDLEKFLTHLLTHDEDAGLRSRTATTLGLMGSEKCLTTLAHTAAGDRTTDIQIGDVVSQSSARRAATFAIAALVARFPKLADDAAARLRAIPVVNTPLDHEGLADARAQALYQITRDGTLLKPFYARLTSSDAGDRERGVVAFRFLKLKEAPAVVVNALKDTNASVRSWSALVLGEIGDPKTGTTLMRSAADRKENVSVRCNAISALGQMRTVVARDLMEKLLSDPSVSVQTNAAIALYRLTGKKVTQFPEGYDTR